MKKLFILSIVLFNSFLIFSQKTKKDINHISITFQSGIGYSKIQQNNSILYGFSKRDAVHINYNLKNGLKLITGIGFNNYNSNTSVKKISYVDIPLKVGFNLGFNGDLTSKVYLLAALGFNYNIFSDIILENQTINFNKNNFGLVGDLGVNFPLSKKMFLNLFFSFSNNLTKAKLTNNDDFKIKDDKKVNISIGYSF
ncbi:outer membrane beta-barrel protein [Tenacibaculum sp. AHE15PA]|uniref:PorT family protein n=1 Tax=unclassified Tenacibaculum TaxID=2635139 RepID=UPI001C4F422E|nr:MULTISPECIES: PorT family protein [unclassified Tenacibaculum]QXP73205.1 outer membrane beta-barrel protein [Tenacibaculum sp. AHE14PA]QXP77118.1 outer membrane beta-barrel protein [Tenacibaculum sp. AHE15PA]